MTCEKFESVMGYHCSPVLMGMKPANLVSFSKEKIKLLWERKYLTSSVRFPSWKH